jgi:sugar phosphate isomerase/epimerase
MQSYQFTIATKSYPIWSELKPCIGIRDVEFNLYPSDCRDVRKRNRLRKLVNNHDILPRLHAPYTLRKGSVTYLGDTLEVARLLDCDVVMHASKSRDDRFLFENLNGTRLLIENTTKFPSSKLRNYASSHGLSGVTFDYQHSYLAGEDPVKTFRTIADISDYIHIANCITKPRIIVQGQSVRSKLRYHLPLNEGDVTFPDWVIFFTMLLKMDFGGTIVFEITEQNRRRRDNFWESYDYFRKVMESIVE